VETEFRFEWSGISFRVEWKQNSISTGGETELHFGVLETESFGISETESFGVLETESFGVLDRIVLVSWKGNSVSV
jgi:hypothetical protein